MHACPSLLQVRIHRYYIRRTDIFVLTLYTNSYFIPALLAGDRTLVDVVVHELTHSWFGNGVTYVQYWYDLLTCSRIQRFFPPSYIDTQMPLTSGSTKGGQPTSNVSFNNSSMVAHPLVEGSPILSAERHFNVPSKSSPKQQRKPKRKRRRRFWDIRD